MQITKLEYQKKDKNRVNVYVDGKFAVGIGADEVIKLNLYKDKEIGAEELRKIIGGSEFGKKFNAALNFLSFRPRSEFEIRQFLKRKNKGDSGAAQNDEQIIEKLKTLGQIDDEAFARWYVEQRSTFRPKGRRALKYELLRKGVGRKVIDNILKKENGDTVSELELAMKAVPKSIKGQVLSQARSQKRGPQAPLIKGTEKDKLKIKLQRFLVSRGFDWDVIEKVVEKVLGGEYNLD